MQKIFQFVEDPSFINEFLEKNPTWRVISISTVAIGDCKTKTTVVLEKPEEQEEKKESTTTTKKKSDEEWTKGLEAISGLLNAFSKALEEE